jgi:serine/threonine protein kinase/Tol biopolymer transport system component
VALNPGARIGPYEIVDLLGSGGMGEVYRAIDTHLGRQVAIKVLPDLVARDPDRLARFEREARTLASLNHPNIAIVHGLEKGNPSTSGHAAAVLALVMELVEGPTLADRIARGPMPLDEAVTIARQITEALEAAHELGIIHRDLKPANIKLRPDGVVKVLDFGLAKALAPDAAAATAPVLSMSPTITAPGGGMTQMGVILGTAAYMSPEQARGRLVDKRTDVWAFGCVLYEMLSGRRAFDGEDVSDVIGAVIHREPDWSALPASIPSTSRLVLQRCLEKDPKRRLRDIGDVRLALDGAFETGGAPAGSSPSGRSRRGMAALTAAVALVASVATGVGVWSLARPGPPLPPSPMQFTLQPSSLLLSPFQAVSPDGRSLAFFAADTGGPRLYVHSFESGETRVIERAGTVSGAPFWSADSRFIAYTGQGKLRRIDPAGGPPEDICCDTGIDRFAGGTWGQDGVILFADGGVGVMRVPATGGTPTPVTKLDRSRKETAHSGPWFLPGGRRFLYLRSSSDASLGGAYVGSLDATPEDQDLTRLVATQQNPLYTESGGAGGRLLFMRDGTLMAQPLESGRLALAGDAVRLADHVGTGSGLAAAYGQFSVSTTGVLVFRHGLGGSGSAVWVTRTGQEEGAIAAGVDRPAAPRLSPNGRRLALLAGGGDVWVYDVEGRPPIRLTFDGGALSPLWTPDGGRIAFEFRNLVVAVAADGSGGAPEPMSPATGHYHPHGWSADGREIILASLNQSADVVRFSVGQKNDPMPIVATPASEGSSGIAVSPDGWWLAYVSDQTGRNEVWVRPLAGPGAPVRVSPGGGVEPVWARNSRELFYREATRIMAVAVTAGNALNFGPPTMLFDSRYAHGGQTPTYDVAADGRFVMIKAAETAAAPFNILINWAAAAPSGER